METLQLLASYLPAALARRLARDPSPWTAPQTETFSAAVLFVDISGFTRLTQKLTQQGPAGVEELTRVLKTYFGQLIDLIAAHGGEVFKFAGDGLLALWLRAETAAPTAALAEATLRAAQCGLAIQANLHNFPAADQILLTSHIGLSAGEVTLRCLGGAFGHWEFLLAGDPVAQATLACAKAESGQCRVAGSAWELIEEKCQGVGTLASKDVRLVRVQVPISLQNHIAPTLVPGMQPVLRQFISTAIDARLEAGQAGWIAELRQVTVLFINLPQFTHRTPLPQAQTIIHTIQEALQRYEGSIKELDMNDQGTTVIAAFGLPPLAHADDPWRGMRATLVMHAALRALQVPAHIGLTTGRVFCGTVGNTLRREYTVLGDPMNLAARLMQAAAQHEPGLLCDQATYQATQAQIKFETLPARQLKGQAQAVPLYQPVGEQHAWQSKHTRTTTLVGRATERAQLQKALDALQAGTSQVVVIEGEAGVGKSQLVLDLKAQAQARNLRCLVGAADAVEQTTTYNAWRPIFGEILAADTWPTEVAARQARAQVSLQNLLGKSSEELAFAPLLNPVLAVNLPENIYTQILKGEGRASETNNWLSQLLKTYSAGQPLVIMLEDVHWLDSASWKLARLVSLDVQPVMLVLVSRPVGTPVPKEYQHFLDYPGALTLRLENLPAAEAIDLVCIQLGVRALPEPVATFIQTRGEGHPFFSEELAYALRDAGAIKIANGECRLVPEMDLETLSLPNTVQGVIAGRIDRLIPQEQLALKVASVIGRMFTERVLQAVHPIKQDVMVLPKYLTNLIRRDITLLETPPPDTSYLFKHIITQQVAYDLMLFGQRRQLHQAVAEWYEQNYATDLTPHYPLLAHHWHKAEGSEKAVHYLVQAGEQAMKRGAHAEAVAFLTSALELEAQLPTRLAAMERARCAHLLGEAHYGLGQLAQSRAALVEAVTLLGLPLPQSPNQVRWGLLRELGKQIKQRLLPRTQPLPPAQSASGLLAAQAYQALALVMGIRGERVLTFFGLLRALNLAEAVGTPALSQQARGYISIVNILELFALPALAERYLQLCKAILPQLTDLETQAWVYCVIGINLVQRGRWAEADLNLGEARRAAEQVGAMRRREMIGSYTANSLYFQGQFQAAAAVAAQLCQLATRQGDKQAYAWGLCIQARCELQGGQTEASQLRAEQASKIAAAISPVDHFSASGLMLLAHVRLGNWSAAETVAAQMLKVVKTFSFMSVIYIWDGYWGLADYDLTLAEQTPSPEHLEAAQASCQRLQKLARPFEIVRPLAWFYEGWYQQLAGQPRQAQKFFAKGAALAAKLQMPYEEGLNHYHWGRFLPSTDPARQTHLAQALALFERIGAAWEIKQVRALLAGPA